MKRTQLIVIALLLVASLAFAKDKQNSGQQAQQKGQDKAAQQQAPAQAAPTPGTKQAKSKEEYAAYNAAIAITDPAALEAAANDFATKFPDSELKGYLYVRAVAAYQQTGNSEKVVDMGRKALAILPDDAGTLAMIASEIVEHTRDTDLDRDERLAEATKYAQSALQNIDKLQAPPTLTPEQVTEAKNQLRSTAISALGTAAYKKKDYATAEKQFRAALDAYPNDPDKDYVMLRVTVSLDKQNKYAEALEWANKTIAASKPGSQVQQLANQEKTRLTPLANAPAKPAGPAPAAPQPQTVTPK